MKIQSDAQEFCSCKEHKLLLYKRRNLINKAAVFLYGTKLKIEYLSSM